MRGDKKNGRTRGGDRTPTYWVVVDMGTDAFPSSQRNTWNKDNTTRWKSKSNWSQNHLFFKLVQKDPGRIEPHRNQCRNGNGKNLAGGSQPCNSVAKDLALHSDLQRASWCCHKKNK